LAITCDKPDWCKLLACIQRTALPGHAVQVGWCSDLHAPILSIVKSPLSGLVFGSDVKQILGCDDPDEIVRRIVAAAEAPIRDGFFSCQPEELCASWGQFTPTERELIEVAFRK
jgi:hypothetical protein